jgi:5'-methylthioadenosine phosphorylase
MSIKRIGIIGGSGMYDIPGLEPKDRQRISTPFGEPSDEIDLADLDGRSIAFLPRHGRGHRLLPSEINYRANVYALKKLGVEWIVSISAVGSLKKEIEPLDVVLVDQFFDRTANRSASFFGDGLAAHVAFAEPVCPTVRRILYEAGQEEGVGARIHWGGTYCNIDGPAFSTKAESNVYRAWGCDVIGMTNGTEAKLAREAEMCFATMALVTDYDAWMTEETETVSVGLVLDNLKKSTATAKSILINAIQKIPTEEPCRCRSALKGALVTNPHLIPVATRAKLDIIIGKYFR